jgi:E3 ubiquitin-protein ligase TRIP12
MTNRRFQTLDKISEECASSVARQGGLPALLNFLDFFNTSVQRTALHAAANCCRNASPDVFKTIRESFPIIRNVLSYPDQRLVESASLCVIRTIESYHRTQPDLLDELLVQDDMGLVRAIIALLLPAGGSPVISTSTYTLFLRALSTAAKASPKTTIALLEADIASTVYQILTGVIPSASVDGAEGTSDQGVAGTLADMAVMQNLAHRPKEQVEEALSLISELMPPLPKGELHR